MQEISPDLLSENELVINTIRRKDLLPWWIKVFMWIFLVMGAISPLGLIFGITGYNFQVALYGFETSEPLSAIGMGIILLFIFKGITSYGFLKEKGWAIKLGIADAITGLLICIVSMIYHGPNFSFRLEIVILIPYLIKLLKIKEEWENSYVVQG